MGLCRVYRRSYMGSSKEIVGECKYSVVGLLSWDEDGWRLIHA